MSFYNKIFKFHKSLNNIYYAFNQFNGAKCSLPFKCLCAPCKFKYIRGALTWFKTDRIELEPNVWIEYINLV